jgi:hypothetical protein
MPALQPYLIEPIWEQFSALLPGPWGFTSVYRTHPECRRRRHVTGSPTTGEVRCEEVLKALMIQNIVR